MRPLSLLDIHRDRVWEHAAFGVSGDDYGGAFKLKSATSTDWLRISASSGEGWDHVSVSTARRAPSWAEMEQVKHLFFRDDETAMQLHVPSSDHINFHPYCLHLWRPQDADIPRPPAWMVGPTSEAA